MHAVKGTSIAECLSARTGYAMNPEKTAGGELISSYACDPRTVDNEFLLSKGEYKRRTGREEASDVIAYQVRQSFKPGEVTAEEANQIGYEFAQRFLKGKHAFIVCTHTDKAHIHNHIIWNSTNLDGTGKYRDFLRSGQAVARLSDQICLEHQLSIITNPKRSGHSKWTGQRSRVKHSQRDLLRQAIDQALAKNPESYEDFLRLMREAGYEIRPSSALTFSTPGGKSRIRASSLGDGYSEAELRAVILGKAKHTPSRKLYAVDPDRPQTLIDIQAKLAAGMGEGYRRWATVENLKRMAKTQLYLDEHGISYEELVSRKQTLIQKEQELSGLIDTDQTRLAELNVLKTHIVNYVKTKDVYTAYRKAGYSKKFLAEHESDIIIHQAAKKAFDEMGVAKLPTVKSLQIEFSEKLTEKKAAYAELRTIKEELRKLAIHQANYEELRDMERQMGEGERAQTEERKEQER